MTSFQQIQTLLKSDWTIKSGLYMAGSCRELVENSVLTAEKERHNILIKIANTFISFYFFPPENEPMNHNKFSFRVHFKHCFNALFPPC